jgi:Bifunctional DNA primase/polymerase, N-terminal
MNSTPSRRIALVGADHGNSWPELLGVTARHGSRGMAEKVAVWAAEEGYVVLAMMPIDEARRKIERAQATGDKPPSEKQPVEKWKDLGYRTAGEIRQSGAFRRRCGVAILTGPSGKVVLDTDGTAGTQSLARLRAERTLPKTRRLATHNGIHRIYEDGGVEYKTQAGQLGEGIDVRGRGGIEVIYDPSQPERHFTDLRAPVPVPRWLAPKIPKADEPARLDGQAVKLNLDGLVANGIPPGQHDETMMRLAMKLAANETIDRASWPLLAGGILERSGEGVDADGRARERFSAGRIMGWWDSAIAKLDAGEGEPSFTVRPMSDEFEEVSEDIGPDTIAPVSGITAVIGESNVGKSPLCYWILLERVRAGSVCGIYETEMGAFRIQKKLRELGASDEELSRILNFGDWGDKDRDLMADGAALCREARARGVGTFLLDSQIGLISASGISENDASAVRAWVNSVAGSLVAGGVSVLLIDHVGLGDDGRGRGTSDKKPACDFAVVMREVVTGRVGVSGEYTLQCTKDRSARFIGARMDLHHVADSDGGFTYKPDGWGDDFSSIVPARAGSTQQQIVAAVGDLTRVFRVSDAVAETGLTKRQVEQAITRGRKGSRPVFEQVGRGLFRVTTR